MEGTGVGTEEESHERCFAAIWASGHEGMNQSGSRRYGKGRTEVREKEACVVRGNAEKWIKKERSTRYWVLDPGWGNGQTAAYEKQDGREAKRKGLFPGWRAEPRFKVLADCWTLKRIHSASYFRVHFCMT